jgi:hypothetical protein
MNAALWTDIMADVASAERHFGGAASLVEAGVLQREGIERYGGEMAIMHAMQAGHTSLEVALRRLLTVLGEPLPTGGETHADLIRRLALPVSGERPAALSAELAQALDVTRRFRHIAIHTYDAFRDEGALQAIHASKTVVRLLRPELEAFRARLNTG